MSGTEVPREVARSPVEGIQKLHLIGGEGFYAGSDWRAKGGRQADPAPRRNGGSTCLDRNGRRGLG